jgi:molybdenum cofactor biosynthesis protein B
MASVEHAPRVAPKVRVAVVSVFEAAEAVEERVADTLMKSLESHGHVVVRRGSVSRDPHEVQRALREAIEDESAQAIIIVGGTGLAKDDATVEAVEPFEEKSLPGFGEALRSLSAAALGPGEYTVRCRAFVSERKVVFCLPGRESVVKMAAERLIGPTLENVVAEASR